MSLRDHKASLCELFVPQTQAEPGRPSGGKSPKHGEKLQNSPPRTGPENTRRFEGNLLILLFGVNGSIGGGVFLLYLRGWARDGIL